MPYSCLSPLHRRSAPSLPIRLALVLLLTAWGPMVFGQTQNQEAAVTWRLLDYIAVDYVGAVRAGEIVNEAEYAEMREFSTTVAKQLAALPPTSQQAALIDDAARLNVLVEQRAAPDVVATAARKLGAQLIAAYPVPLAPAQAPDLARGAALYQSQCAACHGAAGAGDGPAAANLDPAPVDFTDEARARERSIFALYQVITQGLEGTAMVSYAGLPDDDRWALAFYVGSIAYPESSSPTTGPITNPPDMGSLQQWVQMTPAALAAEVGDARAKEITAYVRHHPPVVSPASGDQWSIVRARLKDTVAAYGRGDQPAARAAALSAYLDGFEPLEPLIAAPSSTARPLA